ncbi:WD repeat-containing protein 54-like [Carassius carassius]|uniref:WD repeat-containing protein 54-like n=1 Tax=Carassius carassius TaxID=217509 RepID=UPI0028690B7F|nr:WD repeat-containing protein 54-like [Carassius carassius]
MQVTWCVLPSRDLLVLTSQKGIQMNESDGSIMVYWHALDMPETPTAKAVFARGIAAVREKYICVGVSSGSVLVFDVPSKGSNITLSKVLEEHKEAITDMASECSGNLECIADLVSADDSGLLCVWKSGEDFQLLNKIPGFDTSCSSVKLWKGIVIAGYGTGQIRLYEGVTGILHAEVNAHARWIYSLDIAPFTGLLISAAEDSWVRVWHLSLTPETNSVEIEHMYNECVTDTQIFGAKFCETGISRRGKWDQTHRQMLDEGDWLETRRDRKRSEKEVDFMLMIHLVISRVRRVHTPPAPTAAPEPRLLCCVL